MFWIDIEDANGNRLGRGPITNATGWQATKRLDRAGAFSFALPASDTKSSLITPGRIAAIYDDLGVAGGAAQYVGGGIIDDIATDIDDDGTVMLQVSGDDMLRELSWRAVGSLSLASGSAAITHAAAVSAVAAFAPAGWSFVADAAPGWNAIYGQFAGESVLAAALAVAGKSRDHVWLDGRRTLRFATAWTASGVRAVQGPGAASETAAIRSLSVEQSSYELFSRIYPRGAGQANAALTLRATTRSAPAGYTLSTANNYLEATAVTAAYGRRERYVDFKDIAPLSNTVADVQAAADMLFDSALYWLLRHGAPVTSYRVALAGCAALLRPMQTVRLVYRDPAAGLNLDATLYILEATWSGDASGLRTVDLVVADSDQWPDSDAMAVADSIQRGTVYEAHPQLNANSYAIPYSKHLDLDSQAEFRFRLDDEITQLTRVTFDFEVLPLESTVKSIGAESVTAAANGDHTHNVTVAAHTHSVTIPDHTHSVTIAAHTHTVTIPAHDHTVTVAAHTHTVTVPDHTHTVTIAAHSHGVPDHTHRIKISGGSTPTYPVGFGAAGTSGGLVANAAGSDFDYPTNSDSGSTTTNSGGSSTPTSSSGGGSTPTSSSGGGSTPTTSTAAASTPTSSSGGSSTPTTSSGGGTTGTSGSGGGSTPTSASGGSHTHTVTPTITTEYGIYRDAEIETFGLSDLEYSLDGSTWFRFAVGVNGYTTLGDGWTRIDLTALLQEPVTLRPANTNNLLRVRAHGEEVYVADFAQNRVQVLTATGTFVRKWGTAGNGDGQFDAPRWVAVAGDEVYVTDWGNNRVQVFTTAGAFVRKWGTFGTGDGQFDALEGIAVAGGNVYVADYTNNRVQVFTTAGAFVRKWGTAGTGDGQLDGPTGIAVSGSNVYVSDFNNKRVQVFTTTGTFVRKWGAAGTGDGQFGGPMGLAVVGSEVLVADAINGDVQAFTTTGTFVRKMAAGTVNPHGLAVSGRRWLVVDMSDAARAVESYSLAGTFLRGWGASGAGDGQFLQAIGVAVAPALGGQRATIDAQLTIRNIIQAVAYL